MGTIATPYKTGTIASIAADRIETNTTGAQFTQQDVGRIIAITSGRARRQYRWITVVRANQVEVSHPWDATNVLGYTDQLPEAGDTFSISYTRDEVVAAHSDITYSQDVLRLGELILRANVWVNFQYGSVGTDSRDMEIPETAGLVIAKYNYVEGAHAYPVNTCKVTDAANTFSDDALRPSSGDSFGVFDMWGGSYEAKGALFLRAYSTIPDPTNEQFRMMFVEITGSFGGRFDGDRSAFIVSVAGGRTEIGPLNLRRVLPVAEVSVYDFNYGSYTFRRESPNSEITFKEAQDIHIAMLRINNQGQQHTAGTHWVFGKYNEMTGPPHFVTIEYENSHAGTVIYYGNTICPRFQNSDLTDITAEIHTSLLDLAGTEVNNQTITNSLFAEYKAIHTSLPTTIGDHTLTSGTAMSPHTLHTKAYGYKLLTLSIPVTDTYKPDLTMFADADTSESDVAVVTAYTELETVQKLYDYMCLWQRDNLGGRILDFIREDNTFITGDDYEIVFAHPPEEADGMPPMTYSEDDNRFTVRASSFTGNFQGLLARLLHPENFVYTGSIRDRTRDTQITFTSSAGFESNIEVFATRADAEANTNRVFRGLVWGFNLGADAEAVRFVNAAEPDGTKLVGYEFNLPAVAGVYNQPVLFQAVEARLLQVQHTVDDIASAFMRDGDSFRLTEQPMAATFEELDADGLISLKPVELGILNYLAEMVEIITAQTAKAEPFSMEFANRKRLPLPTAPPQLDWDIYSVASGGSTVADPYLKFGQFGESPALTLSGSANFATLDGEVALDLTGMASDYATFDNTLRAKFMDSTQAVLSFQWKYGGTPNNLYGTLFKIERQQGVITLNVNFTEGVPYLAFSYRTRPTGNRSQTDFNRVNGRKASATHWNFVSIVKTQHNITLYLSSDDPDIEDFVWSGELPLVDYEAGNIGFSTMRLGTLLTYLNLWNIDASYRQIILATPKEDLVRQPTPDEINIFSQRLQSSEVFPIADFHVDPPVLPPPTTTPAPAGFDYYAFALVGQGELTVVKTGAFAAAVAPALENGATYNAEEDRINLEEMAGDPASSRRVSIPASVMAIWGGNNEGYFGGQYDITSYTGWDLLFGWGNNDALFLYDGGAPEGRTDIEIWQGSKRLDTRYPPAENTGFHGIAAGWAGTAGLHVWVNSDQTQVVVGTFAPDTREAEIGAQNVTSYEFDRYARNIILARPSAGVTPTAEQRTELLTWLSENTHRTPADFSI